jgi:hypothetical protein
MRGTSPARRWLAATTAAIVAGHTALRLATLWRLPPYFDESFYALQGWAATIDPAARFDALADGKGPLFNWLTTIPILLGAAPLTAVRRCTRAAQGWQPARRPLLRRRPAR